jgi:hypothetical protein
MCYYRKFNSELEIYVMRILIAFGVTTEVSYRRFVYWNFCLKFLVKHKIQHFFRPSTVTLFFVYSTIIKSSYSGKGQLKFIEEFPRMVEGYLFCDRAEVCRLRCVVTQ